MEKKVAKIIFLDFDGVLNTEYHQRQLQFEGKIWQDKHGASFDPEAVKQLQAIVDKTHADIVIESSWKYLGLETMQETRGTGLLHLPTIKFSKAIVLRWLGARQRFYGKADSEGFRFNIFKFITLLQRKIYSLCIKSTSSQQ